MKILKTGVLIDFYIFIGVVILVVYFFAAYLHCFIYGYKNRGALCSQVEVHYVKSESNPINQKDYSLGYTPNGDLSSFIWHFFLLINKSYTSFFHRV